MIRFFYIYCFLTFCLFNYKLVSEVSINKASKIDVNIYYEIKGDSLFLDVEILNENSSNIYFLNNLISLEFYPSEFFMFNESSAYYRNRIIISDTIHYKKFQKHKGFMSSFINKNIIEIRYKEKEIIQLFSFINENEKAILEKSGSKFFVELLFFRNKPIKQYNNNVEINSGLITPVLGLNLFNYSEDKIEIKTVESELYRIYVSKNIKKK